MSKKLTYFGKQLLMKHFTEAHDILLKKEDYKMIESVMRQELQQCNVSGSLPALVGLSEYINKSYDFVDGDWYWKVDVEGDCPLSIEQVIANFVGRQ